MAGLDAVKTSLDAVTYRRARHVITENDRTQRYIHPLPRLVS